MKLKHFFAVLGLSLISLGMSAQISVNVVDNADHAGGKETHHKIRFDYVICDGSNNIVKVETNEFRMKKGNSKAFTLTAPSGYHVDPVVHLQLRQKPDDDGKWHNAVTGTFYAKDGKINLIVEGSSRKGYALMVGSGSSPAFTKDDMDAGQFIDAQNAKKGQTALGAARIQKENSIAAAKARAEAEKKAAQEKAAAEEAKKMEDFNRIKSVSGSNPTYLSSLKVVVRDNTSVPVSGAGEKLVLHFVLCDATNHQMQKVESMSIPFTVGKKDAYTKDYTAPSGYVIKNGQIHYEIRVKSTIQGNWGTAESGFFTVNNEKLDGVYALKAYINGTLTADKKPSMYTTKCSSLVRENTKTSGEDFAVKIRKQISDEKLAKNLAEQKAAAEKKAAEDKKAAEKKAAEDKKAAEEKAAADAKKYGLPEIKVTVYDMASSDGPQSKHRVFLDYVLCDQKTGTVLDVKRATVLLNGDNDSKTVTLAAPAGSVIRDGIHAEISTRKSGSGAAYVSKLTGIFKYGTSNTMNINIFGTTDAISLKTAGSAPFTKDALSANDFKTANMPK